MQQIQNKNVVVNILNFSTLIKNTIVHRQHGGAKMRLLHILGFTIVSFLCWLRCAHISWCNSESLKASSIGSSSWSRGVFISRLNSWPLIDAICLILCQRGRKNAPRGLKKSSGLAIFPKRSCLKQTGAQSPAVVSHRKLVGYAEFGDPVWPILVVRRMSRNS